MSIFYVDGRIKGPRGKEEDVRFLIDSGATYSLLPRPVWEAIELRPKRDLSFGTRRWNNGREIGVGGIPYLASGRSSYTGHSGRGG